MSRTTLRVVRAAITVLLVCAGPAARAQETGTVPLGHPAYADVDRLVELGALEEVVVGQRPYSRRELRRLYAGLARRFDESRARADSARTRPLVPAAVEAMERLRMHLGAILDADPDPLDGLLDAGRLTAGSTDALRRGFSGTLTRTVEATIDPLAERRLGVLPPAGQSLAVELTHRAEPMPWLAFNLGERFEGSTAARGEPARGRADLLLGGVRARYRNVALQVGREQVGWAQRPGDGLLIASDAPALDMVSLSGDTPFVLPGLLRHLGPTQATILLADLGASVARSHS